MIFNFIYKKHRAKRAHSWRNNHNESYAVHFKTTQTSSTQNTSSSILPAVEKKNANHSNVISTSFKKKLLDLKTCRPLCHICGYTQSHRSFLKSGLPLFPALWKLSFISFRRCALVLQLNSFSYSINKKISPLYNICCYVTFSPPA